ncbi:uncharacterized protein [Euphorbia lathyris]|uniref:uncharacterized protein isoform X1 n=1 Tax=Euphorbia lathyris TaxID=212925 RepID=UPI00331408FD
MLPILIHGSLTCGYCSSMYVTFHLSTLLNLFSFACLSSQCYNASCYNYLAGELSKVEEKLESLSWLPEEHSRTALQLSLEIYMTVGPYFPSRSKGIFKTPPH